MKSKKPFSLFLLFYGLFPLGLFCQDLNVFMTTDTLLIMNPNTTDPYVTDSLATSLVNTGQNELTMDIIRLENNIYPNWLTGLCVDVCYYTVTDSVRISIPPTSSKLFKLYFRFFGLPIQSSAHAKILFRNVSDPTNHFLQDYYAMVNSELTGINENNTLSEIQFFPNPVSDKLTISGNVLKKGMDFILFDPLGKEVLRKSALETSEISIDVSQLTSGVYIYQLMEKEKVFTTGRLNKE